MSSPSSDANEPLPEVDERLVAPGSGYEIDDGKLVRVSPCDPPHGECHARLAALLAAHVADDYKVALDMLTRTSATSDIAPDASVFARAPNPATGGRMLEEVAFQVVSTETLSHAGGKARQLVARGVRRVFAIDVSRARVFEWSSPLGDWSMLDGRTSIHDPTLAVALPVEALARETRLGAALARAMLARRDPELVDAMTATLVEAVVRVLAARGLHPDPEEQRRILAERDRARVERWISRAATCATVGELLAMP